MGRSDLIPLELKIVRENERSLVVTEGVRDKANNLITHILPLSQIEVGKVRPDGFCEITMPEWLAFEKGLI